MIVKKGVLINTSGASSVSRSARRVMIFRGGGLLDAMLCLDLSVSHRSTLFRDDRWK